MGLPVIFLPQFQTTLGQACILPRSRNEVFIRHRSDRQDC